MAAMASEESTTATASASASSSAADSYIGSLISLTSKSEIRYEGTLITINPQESTIALQNVRSYGTEGRKRDGPQIPPSEKVYEYILFRGTDIKDLQVKSSSSIPTKAEQHNDPAIIQSQYQYAPTTHTSSASVGDGSLTGLSSYAANPALARPSFPDAYSSYQTGAHLGSWVSSPVPTNAVGASLTTPMYGQGYAGASSGQAHAQLQSVPFQPQPVINQLQYPEAHALTGMPNLSERTSPSTFSLSDPPSHSAISNPADPSLSLSRNTLLSHSLTPLPSQLPTMHSYASTNQESNTMNLASGKAGPSPTPFLPIPSLPFSSSSILGSVSGSVTARPLLTPNQLTMPTVTASLQKLYPETREMGNLLPSFTNPTNPSPSVSPLPQEPLLPLPLSSQQSLQGQQGVTQFSEEFDFTAMNEKFNKDEVWGSLGKAKEGGMLGDRTEEVPVNDDFRFQEPYVHDPKFGGKPVYIKDDFFDTLSCNSLNRGGWSGRTKFSERMKLDTETFGEFQQRPPMSRGNHSAPRGGNFRGSYYRGRGYGYYGGRGHGVYRPF